MRKIKVGEYVRSKIGSIGKITKIEDDKFLYEGKTLITWIGNVVKHSKNIIDLIEVGDYVNEYKVISIDYDVIDNNTDCIELDLNNNYQYNFISINQIKDIVTKEQFSSVKYEVEQC